MVMPTWTARARKALVYITPIRPLPNFKAACIYYGCMWGGILLVAAMGEIVFAAIMALAFSVAFISIMLLMYRDDRRIQILYRHKFEFDIALEAFVNTLPLDEISPKETSDTEG